MQTLKKLMQDIRIRFIFYLFLFSVILLFLKIYDQSIFTLINANASLKNGENIFPLIMLTITTIADGSVAIIIISLLYKIRKKYFLPALVSLALAGILIHFLKYFFEISRPASSMGADQVNIIGHNLKNYSFPSGHATTSFILAVFLQGKHAKTYLFLLLGSMGSISRVYLGVHFPSDIWVGSWLGFWLSKTVHYFFSVYYPEKFIPPERYLNYLAIFLGIALSIVYIFYLPLKHPEIDFFIIPLISMAIVYFLFDFIRIVYKQFHSAKK